MAKGKRKGGGGGFRRKARRVGAGMKKSFAVVAGLSGTLLLILFDKGTTDSKGGLRQSIVEAALQPGMTMEGKLNNVGQAAKAALGNGVNYIPAAGGATAHVVGKVLHVRVPITKKWNLL